MDVLLNIHVHALLVTEYIARLFSNMSLFMWLDKLGSPPEKLAMNQADDYRTVQEERCRFTISNFATACYMYIIMHMHAT